MTNAGYLGGKIMAVVGTYSDGSALIAPCDGNTMSPYGTLINGPGEFAGAIGPSGSKKAPVVRSMWKGSVDNQAYDTTKQYVVGTPLYAGTGGAAGLYTNATPGGVAKIVGLVTAVPTQQNSFLLGVGSLI